DATECWLQFDNAPAPLTLRVNRLQTTATELAARLALEEVAVTPGRFAPDALIGERRHPLRRGELAESGHFGVHDAASQRAAQPVMLRHAADVVAPGGRLIYATCSSEPEENEAVASAFLASSPAFAPVDLRRDDIPLPAAVVDGNGHLRTSPHVHGLEAFFG